MSRSFRHMLIGLALMALLISGPHGVLTQPRVRAHRANRHAGADERREKPAARRRRTARPDRARKVD